MIEYTEIAMAHIATLDIWEEFTPEEEDDYTFLEHFESHLTDASLVVKGGADSDRLLSWMIGVYKLKKKAGELTPRREKKIGCLDLGDTFRLNRKISASFYQIVAESCLGQVTAVRTEIEDAEEESFPVDQLVYIGLISPQI